MQQERVAGSARLELGRAVAGLIAFGRRGGVTCSIPSPFQRLCQVQPSLDRFSTSNLRSSLYRAVNSGWVLDGIDRQDCRSRYRVFHNSRTNGYLSASRRLWMHAYALSAKAPLLSLVLSTQPKCDAQIGQHGCHNVPEQSKKANASRLSSGRRRF